MLTPLALLLAVTALATAPALRTPPGAMATLPVGRRVDQAFAIAPGQKATFQLAVSQPGRLQLDLRWTGPALEVALTGPTGSVLRQQGAGSLQLVAQATTKDVTTGIWWKLEISRKSHEPVAVNGSLTVACPAFDLAAAQADWATASARFPVPVTIDQIDKLHARATLGVLASAPEPLVSKAAASAAGAPLPANVATRASTLAGSPAAALVAPVPIVASLGAPVARRGEDLEISGTGLSGAGARPTVFFSSGIGAPAEFPVSAISPTRLTCRVTEPRSAAQGILEGSISVRVGNATSNAVPLTVKLPLHRVLVYFDRYSTPGSDPWQLGGDPSITYSTAGYPDWTDRTTPDPVFDLSGVVRPDGDRAMMVWHAPKTATNVPGTGVLSGDRGVDRINVGQRWNLSGDYVVDEVLFRAQPMFFGPVTDSPCSGCAGAQISSPSIVGTRNPEFQVSWWRNPSSAIRYYYALILRGPL